MDMIRAALGDEQLSYIGISYGTYLGGVYATLFPERVRAMVLDSAYEPTGDSEYDQWVTQPVGFEQAFDNWAAWCEEGTECAFADADVGARWDALIASLEDGPGEVRQRPAGQPGGDGHRRRSSALYSRRRVADARRRARRRRSRRRHRAAGDGRRLQRAARTTARSTRICQSDQVIRCASGIGRTPPADPAALLAELHRAAPRFARGLRPVTTSATRAATSSPRSSSRSFPRTRVRRRSSSSAG